MSTKKAQTPDNMQETAGTVKSQDSAKSYIRPHQGLPLRKAGGVMQVNLENIGGRILVLAERNTHKNRMRTIKPVVNVKPPWGHDERKKRGNKMAKINMRRSPMQQPAANMRQPIKSFDITTLSKEDEALLADFIGMLEKLPLDEGRALVEFSIKEAEDKQLLKGYSGVFPELSESESGQAQEVPDPAVGPASPSENDRPLDCLSDDAKGYESVGSHASSTTGSSF